jgi:hypothetical protein
MSARPATRRSCDGWRDAKTVTAAISASAATTLAKLTCAVHGPTDAERKPTPNTGKEFPV